MPPLPALDIVMWGRCGLPLANPHMPHAQPLGPSRESALAKPEARFVFIAVPVEDIESAALPR